MAVLTGPNACGKSVYLKQVGMIALLAHLGSWVPAEAAVIPVMDRASTSTHHLSLVSDQLITGGGASEHMLMLHELSASR